MLSNDIMPDGLTFIYQIFNKVTGSSYVGSTKNPSSRWYHHSYSLKMGLSHHTLLQKDFDKYGIGVYEFEIIDATSEDARDLEDFWIDQVPPSKTLNIQNRKGSSIRAHKRLRKIRKNWKDGLADV